MTADHPRRRPVLQGSGAALAGLLFAVLFTVGFALLDQRPAADASEEALTTYYRGSGGTTVLIAGAYLVPFAGVSFLWFLAASRHRLSQLAKREDALLGTVQLGAGLLFVAVFFASAAAGVTGVMAIRLGGTSEAQTINGIPAMFEFGEALLMIFAFRVAAVFIITSATRALRAGLFPLWFAVLSYATGLVLLFVLSFVRSAVLLVPAWVAAATILTLFRRVTGRLEEA
ncbi:hypothetical protein [Xylanimonas sp. McL0601]|uniref:hypothetical protein n=1 Tax=Xylanimonas sp. McL0601 TaxID=3414739 RepID=UPI003CF55A27